MTAEREVPMPDSPVSASIEAGPLRECAARLERAVAGNREMRDPENQAAANDFALALRCVRAIEALHEGRVETVGMLTHTRDSWIVEYRDAAGAMIPVYAEPDVLTAIETAVSRATPSPEGR